jgi:RNA polymerase primary sigma factor
LFSIHLKEKKVKKPPNPAKKNIERFFFGARKETALTSEPKSDNAGSITNKSLLGILAGLSCEEEQELRSRSPFLSIISTDDLSGEQFRVTRERIRQIELKALKKLKHPSRMGKTRTFLDGEGDDSQ